MFRQIIAAFSMFTRLPFWRLCNVREDDYKRIITWWPLVGWFTGGSMALTTYILWDYTGPHLAILFALLLRTLITGALHEDGLADFFDGMGGGYTKERRLEIMKDSHIGTYGVLSLIFYFLILLFALFRLIPQGPAFLASILLLADTFAKWAASNIVSALPYARTAQTAKSHFVYIPPKTPQRLLSLLIALLPLALFPTPSLLTSYITSTLLTLVLILFTKSKLAGYTGDCCGALFLLSELCFILFA